MTGHWQVESVIVSLVYYLGCRRARGIGHPDVRLHLFQATVRNLLTWCRQVR